MQAGTFPAHALAGAVEREHQLSAQPLSSRLRARERLELGDELVVAAEREIRVDSVLQTGQARFLEAGDLRLSERFVAEVRKRLTAPQTERLAQPLVGCDRVAAAERFPPFGAEPLKAISIQLLGVKG